MKLVFNVLRVLLVLLVGFMVGRWSPISTYQEAVGTIYDVDSVTNTYKVSLGGELIDVETKLPLPESNKQIIILLPK